MESPAACSGGGLGLCHLARAPWRKKPRRLCPCSCFWGHKERVGSFSPAQILLAAALLPPEFPQTHIYPEGCRQILPGVDFCSQQGHSQAGLRSVKPLAVLGAVAAAGPVLWGTASSGLAQCLASPWPSGFHRWLKIFKNLPKSRPVSQPSCVSPLLGVGVLGPGWARHRASRGRCCTRWCFLRSKQRP